MRGQRVLTAIFAQALLKERVAAQDVVLHLRNQHAIIC
jgi:hypothetical protein